ncbi:ATP diphosphatase [Novosphingobium kunmingense]|uniref:ATP diphosphatase n=1 Tax=Novosphingobium kunmingense TaxID=1211806 RepID=A0A2N0I2Q2_9SPHN|nr:nucleoside triphosphate pyrophosphohydrolase [Novosphingobium kunmingense]PKB25479.1 ATP diphosphatase [Novosphingobium kunmingense]
MHDNDLTSLQRLLDIMATLRDPERGCDWDRAQDFASIAPYTIEEAYEVADAIERNDAEALKDELGDLLLQVVFHARMAHEAGLFDFSSVAAGIAAKMEARHPHIFGDHPDHGHSREERWESIKASERQAKGATSAMDGVALALPALMRAEKLQKRAARQGFDWPDNQGPAAKLAEEADELAAASTDRERIEEAGDLLFAAVNVARSYGVAPEDALRAANAKFERRFRTMESLAAANGTEFGALDLDQQEELWRDVKASEAGKAP